MNKEEYDGILREEKYKKMWDNMFKKLNEKERYYLAIVNNQKNQEIERLNNKYNKALELLADYNLPCEYDEGKIPDNYCEETCNDDYKKCWNKYIELELKGDSSN